MNTRPDPRKTINEVHCQQCGSTDPEDVGFGALQQGEGYTACCNERAVYPFTDLFRPTWRCDPTDCYHLEA